MIDEEESKITIKTSNDGEHWTELGRIKNIKWLGETHDIQFPHGLLGTIDPQTLRPGTSEFGTDGLIIVDP